MIHCIHILTNSYWTAFSIITYAEGDCSDGRLHGDLTSNFMLEKFLDICIVVMQTG